MLITSGSVSQEIGLGVYYQHTCGFFHCAMFSPCSCTLPEVDFICLHSFLHLHVNICLTLPVTKMTLTDGDLPVCRSVPSHSQCKALDFREGHELRWTLLSFRVKLEGWCHLTLAPHNEVTLNKTHSHRNLNQTSLQPPVELTKPNTSAAHQQQIHHAQISPI